MGRHLAFWKYEKGVYLNNQKVYEEVCGNGTTMIGLSKLPIDSILRRVSEVFANYEKLDDTNYESSLGAFSIFTTEQSVLFDCSWSMLFSELNKIIDIMLEYDCPYYDPQIHTRFDEQ